MAMDRDTTIQTLTDYFAGRDEVVAAYLFGSVARTTSDADVGVLLRDGKPGTLEGFDPVFVIQDELESRCGGAVDVIVMNGAPLDLLHRSLRDGVLVLDRDPLRRMEFELQARMEYLDFLPLLLRYRQSVLRSV